MRCGLGDGPTLPSIFYAQAILSLGGTDAAEGGIGGPLCSWPIRGICPRGHNLKLFGLIEVLCLLVYLELENPSLARVLNDVIVIYPWQSHSRVARRGGTRRIHTGGFSAATLKARVADLCRAVREIEFIPKDKRSSHLTGTLISLGTAITVRSLIRSQRV